MISKCEFLIGKHDLPEKDLLEKSARIKRLAYSSLDSEMKKTDVSKKQY